MLTCCPKCETCFRITTQQLATARGLVRCGHCQKVFNGNENLSDAQFNNEPDEFSLDSPAEENEPDRAPLVAAMSLADEINLDDELSRLTENESQDVPLSSDSDHFDLPSFSAQDDFSETNPGIEAPPYSLDSQEEMETSSAGTVLDDLADDLFKHSPEQTDTPKQNADRNNESYEYSDITDALEEEQNISGIFSDMHQQLELGMAELKENESGSGILDDHPNKNKSRHTKSGKTSHDDEAEINQAIDSIFADSDLSLYGEKQDEPDYRVEKEMLAAFGKDTHINSSSDNIQFEDEAVSLDDLPASLDVDLPGSSGPIQEQNIPRRLRGSLNVAEPEKPSAWKIIAAVFMILLLGTALLAQLALFRNIEIVNRFPQTRPWLEQLCHYAPCRIHSRRDIDKIRILERDIHAHPKAKKALLITTTIVNKASFNQPYPDIRVTLSDLTGSVVAQRHFTPADYLGSLNSPFLLMKSGIPVHIRIAVLDPGRDAVNFEFQFL